MSSRLWWPLYPLFSYCSTLYRLEVMSRCCNNLSYTYIYPYIHTYVFLSTVKHPKQKVVQQIRSGTSRQGCLPLRHYCMMLLLMLLGFDASSSDYLAKWLTHLLVKPTEWVAGAYWLKQSCMLGQSVLCSRALCLNHKRFLPYGSTVYQTNM